MKIKMWYFDNYIRETGIFGQLITESVVEHIAPPRKIVPLYAKCTCCPHLFELFVDDKCLIVVFGPARLYRTHYTHHQLRQECLSITDLNKMASWGSGHIIVTYYLSGREVLISTDKENPYHPSLVLPEHQKSIRQTFGCSVVFRGEWDTNL